MNSEFPARPHHELSESDKPCLKKHVNQKIYRCPPRTPATIETIKSTIIAITMIFLVKDFIWSISEVFWREILRI
jgi:hypothetical protein